LATEAVPLLYLDAIVLQVRIAKKVIFGAGVGGDGSQRRWAEGDFGFGYVSERVQFVMGRIFSRGLSAAGSIRHA